MRIIITLLLAVAFFWAGSVIVSPIWARSLVEDNPRIEVQAQEASDPEDLETEEVDASNLKTTESGLKYADLQVGEGASPEKGDTVVVQYTGRLEDGTVFDSSYQRSQPFSFTLGVGQVIQGWDEGVSSMQVGGKRRLVIPPELAYGSRGAGGVIPPNATLEFDVELLDVR